MTEESVNGKKRKKSSSHAILKTKKLKDGREKSYLEYNGTRIPFPKPSRQYNDNLEPLYCVCRSVDNGELMVGCDNCDDWYHFACLQLDKKYEKLYYKFYCPYCEQEDPGKCQSVFKKKCMLQDCYNPIMINSKFCSRAHGLKYFSRAKQFLEHHLSDSAVSLTTGQLATLSKMVRYSDLATLGSNLPEPPKEQFESFLDVGNPKSAYNQAVCAHKEEERRLEIESNFYKLRQDYLNSAKERCRVINDHFNASNVGVAKLLERSKSKAKKSVSKKFEICGYDQMLNLNKLQWKNLLKSENAKELFKFEESADIDVFQNISVANSENIQDNLTKFAQKYPTLETFRSEQDTSPENCFPNICLLEKRKCQNHAGWQKRVQDELLIRLHNLAAQKQTIVAKKHETDRQHIVEYWEAQDDHSTVLLVR